MSIIEEQPVTKRQGHGKSSVSMILERQLSLRASLISGSATAFMCRKTMMKTVRKHTS